MGNQYGKTIDPAQKAMILELGSRDVAPKEIAVRTGAPLDRVYFVLRQDRLRNRKAAKRNPGAALAQTPAPEPAKSAPDALLATGGRYAELNAYAAEQGISHAQAMQRWHRARLGLPKFGVM